MCKINAQISSMNEPPFPPPHPKKKKKKERTVSTIYQPSHHISVMSIAKFPPKQAILLPICHNDNTNCEKVHIYSIRYTAVPSTKSMLQLNQPNNFLGITQLSKMNKTMTKSSIIKCLAFKKRKWA